MTADPNLVARCAALLRVLRHEDMAEMVEGMAWKPTVERSKFDLAFDILRQMEFEKLDTMQSCQFGYVLRVERERQNSDGVKYQLSGSWDTEGQQQPISPPAAGVIGVWRSWEGDELLEIARETSTLDCFFTGSSCPPDCNCLSAKAGRAIRKSPSNAVAETIRLGPREG
jgi:hypothetical protein